MKSCHLSAFREKRLGLVLSGGAVKASAWHLGVFQALREYGVSLKGVHSNQNLVIDSLIGSSAGAFTHALLLTGYEPYQILEAHLKGKGVLKPLNYRRLLSFKGPFSHGLFSTEGLREYLQAEVLKTDSFQELPLDLFVVASQLDFPEKIIFSSKKISGCSYTECSISQAMAASMAIPLFYKPYAINIQGKEQFFIDGEVRDTLSSHLAEDNGCDLIISSWTHTPYQKKAGQKSLIHRGFSSTALQSFLLMIEKKIRDDRKKRKQALGVYQKIERYLEKHGLQDSVFLQEIADEFNINPQATYLDIFPENPKDYVFFQNSFSLSPKLLEQAFKKGYQKTITCIQ